MKYGVRSTNEDYTSLLEGHKIIEARDGYLILDDDRALEIIPNDGGCICGAGDYRIAVLNTCDNIITRAELETIATAEGEDSKSYRLFVYADNQRINVMSVEGDDGNGYYGTGFMINVVPVSKVPRKRKLNDHLLKR